MPSPFPGTDPYLSIDYNTQLLPPLELSEENINLDPSDHPPGTRIIKVNNG